MQKINYILAHGSSNLFVIIDAVTQKIECSSTAEFVRQVCKSFNSDGLLFVEQDASGLYAMNMYNTDGTQAEMCGNGMRIVARYVDERYLHRDSFTLYSGGRAYPIRRSAPTVVGEFSIPNYGVAIEVRRESEEFSLSREGGFVDSPIEELHPTLRFSYLNLGNPHIVALVEQIDLELLSQLGERVKSLTEIFTRGVNVSLMREVAEGEIFVATYERGVGLTPSCGTAMTASSTASALMGISRWGETIKVRNRGGFVKCRCLKDDRGALVTELIGNATYLERGEITPSMDIVNRVEFDHEREAWERLTKEM